MRRVAVLCMLTVLLVLQSGPVAQATPTPPYLLVNHTTEECAERWIGDDCRWCDPLPGWEVVGLASDNVCPDGYTLLDSVEMACQPYKSQFCCSGGAHRGDCDDLVLHDAKRLCAFVDEIDGCILPDGWRQRPAGVESPSWFCPHDYGWQPGLLACLDERPGEVAGPTEGVVLSDAPTDEPLGSVEPGASPESPAAGLAPGTMALLGLVAIILGAAILGLLVFSQRRT